MATSVTNDVFKDLTGDTRLFDFAGSPTITPYSLPTARTLGTRGAPTRARGGSVLQGGGSAVLTETQTETQFVFSDGRSAAPSVNPNQFYAFQLSSTEDAPTIIESSAVEPLLAGSEEKPDVLLNAEMLAFHVGGNEGVDEDTRATLRLTIGKDENSRDKIFDNVFWAVAAGLNLYDDIKHKRSEGKDLKGDFQKAFGRRPIEVPGGLAQVGFEVVKHPEPKWWQRIFKFLQSDTGKSLVSVIGFPAIANQAISLLDEALSRFDGSNPEVLFKGGRMQLALSKQARSDFTGGNPRIKLGALNPGICVLARGRDFNTIANAKASYWATYGMLVPDGVAPGDVVGGYEDPFKDVTYAVLRIGMRESKLDPAFNYGGGSV